MVRDVVSDKPLTLKGVSQLLGYNYIRIMLAWATVRVLLSGIITSDVKARMILTS